VAAVAKGLQIRKQTDDARSPSTNDYQYIGDAFRIKQILLNFLSNAVKFTSSGTVRIIFSITPSTGGIDYLRYAVTDNGIGIADTSKLFQPFVQADASISRKYGGTGLGLSICQKLANALGGETGVQSVLGEGSTFWVEIPAKKVENIRCIQNPISQGVPRLCKAQMFVGDSNLRKYKLLLAEDNRVNIKVALKMLARLGYTDVTVVENGQLAVDAVVAASSTPYDLILMDLWMPLMDGIKATRSIRAHEVSRGLPRTPILALSASSLSEDQKAALDSGMNGFLSKPMTLNSLKHGIEDFLGSEFDLESTADYPTQRL